MNDAEVQLLKRSSLDDVLFDSDETEPRPLRTRKQRPASWIRSLHLFLEITILSCMITVLVTLYRRLPPTTFNLDVGKKAGSDLSGVVPQEVGARTIVRSWEPHPLAVQPAAFTDRATLNQTVAQWTSMIGSSAFVQASLYDGKGPETPLPLGLFEISAFHQIHCLLAILEDHANLALGRSIEDLPWNVRLKYNTWEEHTAHCFNYLFDAVRCFADNTAEGGKPGEPNVVHRTAAHVCNDFDSLLSWSREPEQQVPASIDPSD